MGSGKARSTSEVHVALLRGINVGGKNRLPMDDLVAMFANLGCRDVRTYIQSGNVVFRADDSLAGRVADAIADLIVQRLSLRVPVVVRAAEEIAAVAHGNPFAKTTADPKTLHVAFLANLPTTGQLTTLDANRSPPDQFTVRGRDIYLWCPNGVARSKLTNAYFDSKLETTSTMRNWRTVLTLADMAGSGD